ncbi:MAG: dihydrofolate reductase [Myxococcales bacterium]|nr:dihydrofolate reductase [Myxococcales bacterium]
MAKDGARDELGLIVAMSRGRVIGRDGRLPWRLSADLAHFKATTLGHCLLVGRRTWESLPGPLPGRTLVVLTRHASFAPEGVERASSLEAAIALAHGLGDRAPIVAGGAAIYALALPLATRVWLTRVDADVAGDVHFPDWDPRAEGFERVAVAAHAADARNEHAFAIEEWVRRGA